MYIYIHICVVDEVSYFCSSGDNHQDVKILFRQSLSPEDRYCVLSLIYLSKGLIHSMYCLFHICFVNRILSHSLIDLVL